MLLLRALLLLAFALLSQAQSPTSSSAVPTHTVAVGADPHKFTPRETNASVGDIIEFRFYPANHSVARADYLLPCIPYEVTGVNRVGIWSGYRPVSIVGVDQPSFQVRINDTNPLFYYCGAPGACLNDGMNATQTWETQHAFALNATQEFVPGQYFDPEGIPKSTSTSVSATSTSITSTSTTSTMSSASPTTTTAAAASGKSGGLAPGGIAGIAIGAIAIALLAAAVFYMYGRQKTMNDVLRNSQHGPGVSGGGGYFSGHMSSMSQYPFSGQKSPIVNVDEHSADGRDRYSAAGLLVGLIHEPNQMLTIQAAQYDRSNPADSESYRSRSPPADDFDRELMIPPLNMNNLGNPSPISPQDHGRQRDSIGGSNATPSPRGQAAEGAAARPRDYESNTGEFPTALRAANGPPQRLNRNSTRVHEMPVPTPGREFIVER